MATGSTSVPGAGASKEKHFVILLGGPGVYLGCDTSHDQSWKNYIVFIQLVAQQNLYKKQPNEKIHLLVYEPAYKGRWDDDFVITNAELNGTANPNGLHHARKKAADKIKKGSKRASPAENYLVRIQPIAKKNGMHYVGINKSSDFWNKLKSFPDSSISRVWYSGHAAGFGLMVSLIHNGGCQAAKGPDTVELSDIKASLAPKFDTSTKTPSKFYGCYTDVFAKKWRDTFKVPAEGAVRKITFNALYEGSASVSILKRMQTTHTSEGDPHWTKFP